MLSDSCGCVDRNKWGKRVDLNNLHTQKVYCYLWETFVLCVVFWCDSCSEKSSGNKFRLLKWRWVCRHVWFLFIDTSGIFLRLLTVCKSLEDLFTRRPEIAFMAGNDGWIKPSPPRVHSTNIWHRASVSLFNNLPFLTFYPLASPPSFSSLRLLGMFGDVPFTVCLAVSFCWRCVRF